MFKKLMIAALAAFALNAFAATDANRASQAELEAVKGLGPSLSNRLIEARSKQVFRNWDDLLERVKGVGPGNAARFSSAGLTVNGDAYTPSSDAAARPARGKAAAKDKSARPARAGKAATPTTAPAAQ